MTRKRSENAFSAKDVVPRMQADVCKFCQKTINKCKSDSRGLCIKSPQSDGKWVKR